MTTDFRAMCAELVDSLHKHTSMWEGHEIDLVARARALLDQQEPQPSAAVEVAASLIELRSTVMGLGQMGMHVAAKRVERAADLLERQRPQPVAEGPTDEELDGVMFQAVWECMDNADDLTNDEMDRLKARAVLARWGNSQGILDSSPQPVAEGPTDEEVDAWADQQGFIRGHGDHPCGFWIDDGDAGALVRAAIARWGPYAQ